MAQMKYFYELTISSSPHAHSPVTTQTIMRDVLIALVPALLGSIYFFGFRALLVTLVSAAACVFFEWGFCKVRKLHCKTYDLSAVVTGVLLAFVCPVTIPYWTIILGDFFAIVLVKMLFGGLGKNIVNPALAGRAFLFSWPVLMSNWVKVGFDNAAGLLSTADAVTAATPMSAMHQGALPEDGAVACWSTEEFRLICRELAKSLTDENTFAFMMYAANNQRGQPHYDVVEGVRLSTV